MEEPDFEAPSAPSPAIAENAVLGLSSQIEAIVQLFTKFSCAISAAIFAASFLISWVIQDRSGMAISDEAIAHCLNFLILSSALVVIFSTLLMISYRWNFSRWKKKHGRSQLTELRFSWLTWLLAIRESIFLWMTFLFVSASVSLLSDTPSPILDFMFSVLLINLQSVLMTSQIRRHMFEKLKALGLNELLVRVSEFKTISISAASSTKSSHQQSWSGRGGGFSGGGATGKW